MVDGYVMEDLISSFEIGRPVDRLRLLDVSAEGSEDVCSRF